MSRKFSALLLALVLVFSLTLCAGAAESNARASIAAQHHGDEVQMTVTISEGQGITNGRVKVTYDPYVLVLDDVQVLAQCGETSIDQRYAGVVYLAWVGSDLDGENPLLQLTFQCKTGGNLRFDAEVTEAYASRTKIKVDPGSTVLEVNPFTDLDNHWAKQEILNAYHDGLLKGMTSTTFVPEGTMTRGMFVTVLYRMASEPEPNKVSGFTDVKTGEYYAKAVAWAVEVGVTNGMGNNKFMPNKAIGRQEMVTMLYRLSGIWERDTGEGDSLADFLDADAVSDWAVDAMSWAVAEEIIEGYPGNYLMPRADATRAQAATIICRYLGY